ncbi:tetratricopeptide repeat protein [Flavobacteriaceae bacterium Ap0902]|nr:tetratricopeptide repeat protein [Flavobacteriaceae bacterium Ap0902]
MSENCMNHIENYWKKLTTQANDYFNQNRYAQALNIYQNALYRAEVLNNHMFACVRCEIPFVQVYIISCNNLANTYQELGELEKAEEMLRRSFYFLLHIASKKIIDFEEIQREIKKVVLNYTQFMTQNEVENNKHIEIFNALKEQLIGQSLSE